jgi:hypothetical protein
MFGYFLIFLIICFLLSLFFYLKLKKNDDDFSYKKMLIHSKDKKNIMRGKTNEMKDHLALALLERDKILNTNGLLPGSNNSICYGLDGKKIKGCKCHPTCKTCGYGKDPKGMNQCLTCINGSDVNSLYNNGAGWCSIENSKKPSMIKTKTGQNVECNDKILELCGLKNKYDNNGDYSEWDKCLKDNEKKLLVYGCQYDKDYKIQSSEPYECGECIRVYNPYSGNKDIGGQKCCSGGEKCYMRRCSVSAEKEKSTDSTTTSTGGAVGKDYHYRYNFSTVSFTENNTTTNNRTITVKIKFDKAIPAKSQITISNLGGVSTTKNTRIKINVISPINKPKLFGSTTLSPRSDSVGYWNKTNGYLLLKVSDGESIAANEEIKFSFNLTLNNNSPATGSSPKVSLLSGDDKYKVLPTPPSDSNKFIFVRNVVGGSSASASSNQTCADAIANDGFACGDGLVKKIGGNHKCTKPKCASSDFTDGAACCEKNPTQSTSQSNSYGYCMDLGKEGEKTTIKLGCKNNDNTCKSVLYYDTKPNCSNGDYTLAVKNEFQCNRITQNDQCDPNPTCKWSSDACINPHKNKWFCSKPKNKCSGQWNTRTGFWNNS